MRLNPGEGVVKVVVRDFEVVFCCKNSVPAIKILTFDFLIDIF